MNLSNENIVHIKKDGLEYLQFKKLLQYPEIAQAYILGLDKNFRIIGNPKNEDEKMNNKKAEKNYREICEELNLNYSIAKTGQKHTDNVDVIKDVENEMDIYENTDGLVTNRKGIVLATTNADCILLIFFDPVKKVIANAHSGWRGTLQRISIKTVEKMKDEYGCNPKDIICCMSPSIRKCHFEVDRDVYEMFREEFKDLSGFSSKNVKKNNKYLIDTILINRLILQNAGLRPENIIDSGICSVCNKDIVHSYRAEGNGYGLAAEVISLIH